MLLVVVGVKLSSCLQRRKKVTVATRKEDAHGGAFRTHSMVE